MNFTVVASVIEFSKDTDIDESKRFNITLNMNLTDASNFIFRFKSPVFSVDTYKVLLKYDSMGNCKEIILIKDDKIYIVLNKEQLISDITEGYFRIRMTDKIVNILDFDFETANNIRDGIDDDVVDEFDLENPV
jgi:hypothetical protein